MPSMQLRKDAKQSPVSGDDFVWMFTGEICWRLCCLTFLLIDAFEEIWPPWGPVGRADSQCVVEHGTMTLYVGVSTVLQTVILLSTLRLVTVSNHGVIMQYDTETIRRDDIVIVHLRLGLMLRIVEVVFTVTATVCRFTIWLDGAEVPSRSTQLHGYP